jgi:hypothetical protein
MVTALIVLGVVVFLAVDAYVLYRVFAGRRRADDYGSFPVPGEIQVMLPAGRVKLSYQESYRASGDAETGIDFGVPRDLHVGVVSPGGESLEIKGPGFRGMGASIDLGSGWSRALVGTVKIAQAGEYTIGARAELDDAVEPQILVGR